MTSDELIVYVKSLGSIPDGRLTDAETLSFGTREMLPVVQQIISAREDYFVESSDFSVASASNGGVRIPSVAIGGKLRDSVLVGANPRDIYRIGRTQLDELSELKSGYYIKGNRVHLTQVEVIPAQTLRLSYYARPCTLGTSSAYPTITGMNAGGTIVYVTRPQAYLDLQPSTSSWTHVDFIKATPGYETALRDATVSQSVGANGPSGNASSDLTLPGGATATTLGIEVGDRLGHLNSGPIVQIPEEYLPVLAQRIVAKSLESIGDSEGFARAQAKLGELQAAAAELVSVRDDGEPEKVGIDGFNPWIRAAVGRRYF